MNYISLNKNSSTPLYAQIKDSIKHAIKSGLLKPNDKLPTEDELCSAFGISRPVIRQAYKELIDENYIIRFKSRGSFVKEPEIKSMFFSEFSDIEVDLNQMGYTPSVQLLSKSLIDSKLIKSTIRKLINGSEVLKVEMVYLGQGIPFVYKEAYYPTALMPGIVDINFENAPIYNALESKLNVWLSHIKRVVDAQIISDDIVGILKTEKGHAIHFVESIAYDDRDRVVEYAHSYYVGDRNEFDMMVYKQSV